MTSLALTIPTLVWSAMFRAWFRFSAPSFPGSTHIAPLFGTAVYLYGGSVFLAGGVRELRERLPGMMTPISLAVAHMQRAEKAEIVRRQHTPRQSIGLMRHFEFAIGMRQGLNAALLRRGRPNILGRCRNDPRRLPPKPAWRSGRVTHA